MMNKKIAKRLNKKLHKNYTRLDNIHPHNGEDGIDEWETILACGCKKCEAEFFTSYGAIRRGHGCPKCTNSLELIMYTDKCPKCNDEEPEAVGYNLYEFYKDKEVLPQYEDEEDEEYEYEEPVPVAEEFDGVDLWFEKMDEMLETKVEVKTILNRGGKTIINTYTMTHDQFNIFISDWQVHNEQIISINDRKE
jgi:hypothetical protein